MLQKAGQDHVRVRDGAFTFFLQLKQKTEDVVP